MAFTTWSALKTKILNDIEAGNIMTQEYSIETGMTSRRIKFRGIMEAMEFLKYIDMQIAGESGGMTAYSEFKRPGQGA